MSFVLYGSGFTAEQSEATRATPLPAEIPKPGGACGELFSYSLDPSAAGPDAACPRAEVLWDGSVWTGCQAGCQWEHSAAAPSCTPEGRAASVPSPHHAEIPFTFPGRRTKPLPWAFTDVRDNWRAGFAQAVPERLGHFSLLHISIPGTATANNCDGKASKCAKDEANQKIEKSPWEDAMLSSGSMVGLSAITTAMGEAKELHSWEINISSLQRNKKTKSMKTLNWSMCGDQNSQLSGWAHY